MKNPEQLKKMLAMSQEQVKAPESEAQEEEK